AGCEAGIDLVELADQALAAGDDCHGRTLAGTQALAAS
ncbi:oxamate carbamoyltransferase subunit AllG family protein, partial [Bordetella pertussis]